MELIDVHAHLADPSFSNDLPEVIKRAKDAGLAAIVVCVSRLSESRRALELVKSNPGFLFLSAGAQPGDADEAETAALIEFIRANRALLVAVGETGLDYFPQQSQSRENQKSFFQKFIELSRELDLPLVVHSRSAGQYVLEQLIQEKVPGVLMHAFDGNYKLAVRALQKANIYFSIPATILRSRQKVKLASALPLDRLMLESDSPVLAPVPGQRNEPASLAKTCRKLAEIKNISFEEVALNTSINARKFFNIA